MLAVTMLAVVRAESVGYGELEVQRHLGTTGSPTQTISTTFVIPCAQETWRGEMQQLSWSPRAFLAKNFLSDEECEHIKTIVR